MTNRGEGPAGTYAYELVDDSAAALGPRAVPERPMIVRLYPSTREEVPACSAGGLAAAAVLDAGEQLYRHGSVDYYAVYRYRTESSALAAPDDGVDWTDVSRGFKRFLREGTDTGEDLYRYRGVHQLVHGRATGCDEDAAGYAPKGAGGEYSEATAFGAGVVTWSPVCENAGLTRNAAIQEAVHSFLHPDVYDESLTGEGHDEHTLGRVVDRRTTPMLTYHWDDDVGEFGGACPSTDERATGYTQRLTECTKDGVAQTAAAKAGGRLG